MAEPQQNKDISGKNFYRTVEVEKPEAEPAVGLFQPWYPLSEADFLRLQKSSSIFAGLGGAVSTFGVSFILPKIASNLSENGTPLQGQDLLIAAIALIVGIAFIVCSFTLSRERRGVRKKIRKHFQSNPAETAYLRRPPQ